ncbi:MAG: hypothetical protein SGJ16_13215 [Nitrospirota bacterium]|nr:hypothetical protein [Nitrospirota bacterium]
MERSKEETREQLPDSIPLRRMLKKAVNKAAADESTGGVAFLTRPS